MMKNKPRVSIIVPVHDAVKTIDSCVKSIISQDYENIECILVENGSSDNSEEICRKYSERYECIRFAISSNAGVSEARNLGLSMATGDIIGFCDADDFIEMDALKTVVSEFEKEPEIIGVIGAFYIGWESMDGVQKQYRGIKRKKISMNEAISLTIGNDAVMGSVWNKYYRAETVNGVCFDSKLSYCEDMHFNVKVLSAAPKTHKIMVIDNPLYCYVQNNQSVTHQVHNFFDEDENLKYIVALKKMLCDCDLDKKCKSIVGMRIAGLAIDYSVIPQVNEMQKIKLVNELKDNYFMLFANLTKYNLKANLIKICKGVILIIKSKRKNK